MFAIFMLALLTVLIYYYILKPHTYWKNKKVPYVKPLPVVGNLATLLFRRNSFADLVNNLYRAMSGQRYVGIYEFLEPTLLIRDPELIKQVTIKDFDVFPERKPASPVGLDLVWDNNLFAMRAGEKWHSMRSILSASFTSSKLKMMFPLIHNCSKQFTSYFLSKEGVSEVEMKDALGRYANDVIATASIGLSCDSLHERDNEVYKSGKIMSDFSGINSILFFLHDAFPKLNKFLNVKVINRQAARFFETIIRETIAIREKHKTVRPDMIHLLMEAKKGKSKQENIEIETSFAVQQESPLERMQKLVISDDDIVSQAIIFHIAGLNTTSTSMSYACYELALNPDVQERLFEEITECKVELTYEVLMRMKYMDMVVSESLRKWPPVEFADRICVRNYSISPNSPDETGVQIEPKTNIWIPVYAIHRDEKYYANPEKFDPERFSLENRHKIKPYTFIPFGAGPRSCIGSRFALLEVKLLLFELLNKFEVITVGATQIPPVLSKGNFDMLTEKGIWLGLKRRK